MNAETSATAGVQPGDTTRIRIQVERMQALRRLRVVDGLIAELEAVVDPDGRLARALREHRAARDSARAAARALDLGRR